MGYMYVAMYAGTLHCVQQRAADINSQRQEQLGPYPFWLIFTHRRQQQQQLLQHLQHKHRVQQQQQQHSFRHLINDRDCNQSSSPTLRFPLAGFEWILASLLVASWFSWPG